MTLDFGSKLVSKLGSPDSKIPLGIKDTFNSTGYTYFSYGAGGSVEGKDRFVDEVGTGAIWLFGIPFYKKLVDKTIFPRLGISPDIDVRVVKDKKYLNQAIKSAPNDEILQELKYAGKNVGKTKALALAKFGISMGLTMLSYFGLTKLKQKMTRLNIEKEFNEKMKAASLTEQPDKNGSANKKPDIFADFTQFGNTKKSKNNPSFGSAAKVAEEFMLNPVKNMIILDVGITGERLSNARTDGEFKEYAIKEGSFLFFVYCADKLIKQGLETASQKFLKMPISLDAQFLSGNMAEDILKNKEMQNQVKDFGRQFAENKDTNKLYEFIFKNQNHTVVKAAKESGIIETVTDKSGNIKIDTRKYIDPDKMKELAKNLDDYIELSKNSTAIKKYLNKVRNLKVASTFLSIGACCFSLGYLAPKYIYESRHKRQDGSSDFHVRTEYEKELAAKAAQKTV